MKRGAPPKTLVMVRVRLSDERHAASLQEFLVAAHARVEPDEEPGVLAVELPGALTPAHERREVAGYLRTWRLLKNGCPVELLPD